MEPHKEKPQKQRVALVLSMGGARGIAHIGVIEELRPMATKSPRLPAVP